MSINFFEPSCQEQINHPRFGLCDDQDGTKAYTNTENPDKWIATVKNNQRKNLIFTAIDKCIIKDNELLGRGRCDGMITASDLLYFVELKSKEPPWEVSAKEQLESTIELFIQNQDIRVYKHKKAFACNSRSIRFRFKEIDNEENLRFYRKYGFRLDLQTEIIVL
jgi:hypothetical protein